MQGLYCHRCLTSVSVTADMDESEVHVFLSVSLLRLHTRYTSCCSKFSLTLKLYRSLSTCPLTSSSSVSSIKLQPLRTFIVHSFHAYKTFQPVSLYYRLLLPLLLSGSLVVRLILVFIIDYYCDSSPSIHFCC